jgi:hypothetical protein
MLSADENENKPVGKPGQRKAKAEQLGKKAEPGKKGEPRKRKDDESHSAKPDRVPDAIEQASAPAEQISEPIAAAAAAPVMSTETSATPTSPPGISPIAVAGPVETTPVSLQTIANAYSDFLKRSFQQTSSFVEQLAGARSLDRALELQTAFAREAYETFVSESKKIRKLHSELAKQRLERLEGFVTKMTQVALNPTRPR